MTFVPGQPWFQDAVDLLDLRRQDRVLAIHTEPRQVRALATLVGKGGVLTVVQPDRNIAEAIAELGLPHVEIFAHQLCGTERFGAFDALLCAVTTRPTLPLGAYGELPRRNLRPGGRLAIDLPAPDMLPQLRQAATTLGWSENRLQCLCGPGDDELSDVLRNAGLRRVQSLLGSHLLHVESPHDLVDLVATAMGLSNSERDALGQQLVREAGSTGAVEILAHRTRLQALR